LVLILLLLEPLLRFLKNFPEDKEYVRLNPSLAGTTSPIAEKIHTNTLQIGLNPSLAGTTSPI